ncbi:uncharacterized protein G2W53_020515 [Senna tora]|uniref:Uncharacterized protein n=1 Tax=Senna tora TaxID=362788 RepID=A0A834TZC6_9FABA|nr:uncharacterized protein G2W53_020515 [Senna tora]
MGKRSVNESGFITRRLRGTGGTGIIYGVLLKISKTPSLRLPSLCRLFGSFRKHQVR